MEMSTPGATRATSSMQTLQSGTVPTRMVAVPGGIAAHQVSGSGGAAALTLPTVSLRKAMTAHAVRSLFSGQEFKSQIVRDGKN